MQHHPHQLRLGLWQLLRSRGRRSFQGNFRTFSRWLGCYARVAIEQHNPINILQPRKHLRLELLEFLFVVIADDVACSLGAWLHAAGRQFLSVLFEKVLALFIVVPGSCLRRLFANPEDGQIGAGGPEASRSH